MHPLVKSSETDSRGKIRSIAQGQEIVSLLDS
jgi:hypothetical protein